MQEAQDHGEAHGTIQPERPEVVLQPDHWCKDALIYRAIRWACPWTKADFPGLHRVALGLLPRAYTRQAIQHWQKGRAPTPPDVSEALAAHIESHCYAGLAIAAQLRAHAMSERGKLRRLTGFNVPRPDGTDRRGG